MSVLHHSSGNHRLFRRKSSLSVNPGLIKQFQRDEVINTHFTYTNFHLYNIMRFSQINANKYNKYLQLNLKTSQPITLGSTYLFLCYLNFYLFICYSYYGFSSYNMMDFVLWQLNFWPVCLDWHGSPASAIRTNTLSIMLLLLASVNSGC